MNAPDRTRRQVILSSFLYGILLLFFLQLISDFIESIYAFGLLQTSLPTEIVMVLLLLSPVVLLFPRKGLPTWLLLALGELMILCRVVEVSLDTRGRMMIAGLGVALFLIFFPSLLWKLQEAKNKHAGPMLGAGLCLAVAFSILLRSSGSGFDLSTYGWSQSIGWVLAILGGALLVLLRPERLASAAERSPESEADQPASTGKTLGLSLATISALALIYFAFASPNVIARWTGSNYLLVVALMVVALVFFALLLSGSRLLQWAFKPGVLLAWNLLFLASLVATIGVHQIVFPSNPAGYPLAEPASSALHLIPLIVMLLSFPVVLIDFTLLAQALGSRAKSPRSLSGGFALGAFFFLVMIFAHIFTTVYDYIPVVGPLFRDKFWLVHLVVGLAMAAPMLLVGKQIRREFVVPGRVGVPKVLLWVLLAVGVSCVAAVALTSPRPAAQVDQIASLRVFTYNIQQGYSEEGMKNFQGQLGVLQSVDADVIGLQESDTNRIANGNADIVRYFADNLDMYSYYGPKTVPGTFGIALLSRYPIENPRTFYMYSEGEQTATIEAQITVGGRTFNVFVTHLGNDGPMVQQQAVLQQVDGKSNVIAMGDYNFRSDTAQFALTMEALQDAWMLAWPEGVDGQGMGHEDRIDHVFVSTGTSIAEAQYLVSKESDHPALLVVIDW
ncbi:MAG: endonuclease/exonuclease/phosphatase family protein [Anaerolineales bacterium]|jgi:endonuclease/exonuclease/phosphatase family metal-dependent hydrolase